MHDVPRVTPLEFRSKVRPALSSHGFTTHQLDQVEAAFHDNLENVPHLASWKPGVDKESLAQTMEFMRKHPGATAIGPHHWDKVEEVMTRHI
jgi:hypothetical protein